MDKQTIPAAGAPSPQDLPVFVLQCGSLFVGVERSSRVANLDRAKRFTKAEAEIFLARLVRPNSAFPLPWQTVRAGGEA